MAFQILLSPMVFTPRESLAFFVAQDFTLAGAHDRYQSLMDRLGIPMPESGMAVDVDEALETANRIGYPVMVRPSYVRGGRFTGRDDAQMRGLHTRPSDPHRPLPQPCHRMRSRRHR